MKFRDGIILVALIVVFLSHGLSAPAAPRVQFSIVYTNDVMGEVEPCG